MLGELDPDAPRQRLGVRDPVDQLDRVRVRGPQRGTGGVEDLQRGGADRLRHLVLRAVGAEQGIGLDHALQRPVQRRDLRLGLAQLRLLDRQGRLVGEPLRRQALGVGRLGDALVPHQPEHQARHAADRDRQVQQRPGAQRLGAAPRGAGRGALEVGDVQRPRRAQRPGQFRELLDRALRSRPVVLARRLAVQQAQVRAVDHPQRGGGAAEHLQRQHAHLAAHLVDAPAAEPRRRRDRAVEHLAGGALGLQQPRPPPGDGGGPGRQDRDQRAGDRQGGHADDDQDAERPAVVRVLARVRARHERVGLGRQRLGGGPELVEQRRSPVHRRPDPAAVAGGRPADLQREVGVERVHGALDRAATRSSAARRCGRAPAAGRGRRPRPRARPGRGPAPRGGRSAAGRAPRSPG